MSTFKRKSTSLFARLRNYFITGIVVLVPIGITLYLTKFFISISSKLIPYDLNPNNYLPFAIPGLEIILSIIFITIIGGLSLSFIGKRILKFVNDLFKRIPILRTIYSAIGQMTESFAPSKRGKKKSVVLIEYPRKGSWAVGFATKDNYGEISKKTNTSLVNVFVPTTPNPTSGFLLMFPKNEVIYLDMIFASLSGYDIRETVKVWERMREANKGKEPPEFMSTHPSSNNRINNITEWINEIIIKYPPII